jgi:hypothetical protein
MKNLFFILIVFFCIKSFAQVQDTIKINSIIDIVDKITDVEEVNGIFSAYKPPYSNTSDKVLDVTILNNNIFDTTDFKYQENNKMFYVSNIGTLFFYSAICYVEIIDIQKHKKKNIILCNIFDSRNAPSIYYSCQFFLKKKNNSLIVYRSKIKEKIKE